MSSILPFIVIGIVNGAVYGLAATGLVLTYKTSGIFNFGHGALATAAAYFFYWMYQDQGWDWKIAALVTVVVVGGVMGLIMERLSRALSRQRTAWKVVGTAGLILLVQGLGTIKFGVDARKVEPFLPKAKDAFKLLDVNIRYSQVFVAAIALVAVAGLYILFRYTRLGVSMRAVVDDPDLLDLQGTDPVKVRRISWMLGSMIASISGILILTTPIGLEPIFLTFLVVQAFGAAAVGMFSSIPLTFAGGLAIGVVESVFTKFEVSNSWLVGLNKGIPFIILIIVMLVTPKHKLAPPTSAEARPALQWQGPASMRTGAFVVVFAALASVPLWADNKLAPYWIGALTMTLIMLSLGLLVRTAGIVSLCTAAFAAIGAVSFSQLHSNVGLPWLVALMVAGLIAVPIGALIAIPSIRLSGLFLALATLGFGLLIQNVFYRRSYMFTVLAEGRKMPRPSWAASNRSYYYLVLAVVAIAVLAVSLIHRGRLGRVLLGLSDSPRAVSTLGLSVNTTRVIVFCVGAYIAAIAGALHGAMLGVADAGSSFFSPFNSIILIAILALAPFRAPWYAIFAGVTQVIPGYIEGKNTPHVLTVIFGFFAIMVALEGGPKAMPARLQQIFESKFGRSTPASRRGSRASTSETVDLRRLTPSVPAGTVPGLSVTDLTVRFGGLMAVDSVTMAAPMGRITGLIGPNGAGKTTTFNSCSGLNRPTHGTIAIHGADVSNMSPHGRARLGLGRSFQIMELCESLTVAENVALGRESSQAGARMLSQLVAPRSDIRIRDVATAEALELCGISDLAQLQAGALSTGQRRLVELARCLAGPFDILLLDEPSSGLDHDETAKFGEILRTVVRERGCGILLVEHDMELVMDVCDYIYVLDFGRLIFEGTPPSVAGSPDVQAAYLGSETAKIAALEAEHDRHEHEEVGS